MDAIPQVHFRGGGPVLSRFLTLSGSDISPQIRALPPTGGFELKHRRIPNRRALLAGAGALALAATATVTLANANASPAPTPTVSKLTAAAANTLASQLKTDTAGAFYDAKAKKLVVNVVNEAAAKTVRAKGAEARLVRHTLAQLDSARKTLKAKATIPGTSWGIDPHEQQGRGDRRPYGQGRQAGPAHQGRQGPR